jgi:inner membrane protein
MERKRTRKCKIKNHTKTKGGTRRKRLKENKIIVTFGTHIVFGVTFYYAGCVITKSPVDFTFSYLAGLIATMPDIDTDKSNIGRFIPFISRELYFFFGHRTVTHSFLFISVITIIFSVLTLNLITSVTFTISIIASLLSHSCSDMATKSGVCFWWPSRVRCVIPRNSNFRVSTGSWQEWHVSTGMLILFFPLYFLAETGQGASGFVTYVLGDIGMAIQDYQENKGEHAWYVDITGTSNKTLKAIDGIYYIAAVKDSSTFYVFDKTQNKITTISSGTEADWFVKNCLLKKGRKESTTALLLEKKKMRPTDFLNATKELRNYKHFISGRLTTKSSAGSLQFHKLSYINLSDLPTGNLFLAIKLRFIIKHSPEVVISKLNIEEDSPSEPSESFDDIWIKNIIKRGQKINEKDELF